MPEGERPSASASALLPLEDILTSALAGGKSDEELIRLVQQLKGHCAKLEERPEDPYSHVCSALHLFKLISLVVWISSLDAGRGKALRTAVDSALEQCRLSIEAVLRSRVKFTEITRGKRFSKGLVMLFNKRILLASESADQSQAKSLDPSFERLMKLWAQFLRVAFELYPKTRERVEDFLRSLPDCVVRRCCIEEILDTSSCEATRKLAFNNIFDEAFVAVAIERFERLMARVGGHPLADTPKVRGTADDFLKLVNLTYYLHVKYRFLSEKELLQNKKLYAMAFANLSSLVKCEIIARADENQFSLLLVTFEDADRLQTQLQQLLQIPSPVGESLRAALISAYTGQPATGDAEKFVAGLRNSLTRSDLESLLDWAETLDQKQVRTVGAPPARIMTAPETDDNASGSGDDETYVLQ